MLLMYAMTGLGKSWNWVAKVSMFMITMGNWQLAAGGSLPLLKGKRCFMLWSCDCCDEGAAIMYQGVLKRLREF
jgi:hypothetical protein